MGTLENILLQERNKKGLTLSGCYQSIIRFIFTGLLSRWKNLEISEEAVQVPPNTPQDLTHITKLRPEPSRKRYCTRQE